jgi:hypothetical protein
VDRGAADVDQASPVLTSTQPDALQRLMSYQGRTFIITCCRDRLQEVDAAWTATVGEILADGRLAYWADVAFRRQSPALAIAAAITGMRRSVDQRLAEAS